MESEILNSDGYQDCVLGSALVPVIDLWAAAETKLGITKKQAADFVETHIIDWQLTVYTDNQRTGLWHPTRPASGKHLLLDLWNFAQDRNWQREKLDDWAFIRVTVAASDRITEECARIANAVPAYIIDSQPVDAPPAAPELLTADALPVPAPQTEESTQERQRRRFDRYRDLGGDRVRQAGGEWRAAGRRGALADLAAEEAAAGRPYNDPRDVARDLDLEAERRRSTRALPS